MWIRFRIQVHFPQYFDKHSEKGIASLKIIYFNKQTKYCFEQDWMVSCSEETVVSLYSHDTLRPQHPNNGALTETEGGGLNRTVLCV